MVTINYDQLQIDHIVEFAQDRTVFAAAYECNKSHLRLFLINESSGNVYTRNGSAYWEPLCASSRDSILARLIAARNTNIPVYKVNGPAPQN